MTMHFFFLLLGVFIGVELCALGERLKKKGMTDGVVHIDHSDPEKDRITFFLNEDIAVTDLGEKKQLIFNVKVTE